MAKRHQCYRLAAVEIIGTQLVLDDTSGVEANKPHCWLSIYVYDCWFANNPCEVELILRYWALFAHVLLLVMSLNLLVHIIHDAFKNGFL